MIETKNSMVDKEIEKYILEIKERLNEDKGFLTTYESYGNKPHKIRYAYKDVNDKSRGIFLESFNNNPDILKNSLNEVRDEENNICEWWSETYIIKWKRFYNRVEAQYFWSLRNMISNYNRLIDINLNIDKCTNHIKKHGDDDFLSKIYKEKMLPEYNKEYNGLIECVKAAYIHCIKMDNTLQKIKKVCSQFLPDSEV